MFQWMRENLKMIMIATVVVFLVTCGVMYGVGGGGGKGDNPGKPVVKINGKKVARIDVEKTALMIAERLASQGRIQITDEIMADCRKKAVENMGLEQELRKEIKERGIKVSRKEVKEQFKQIEANFPTKEEFENYIERSGKSKREIKAEIKFQLQQQKLIEKISSEIKVPDDEVKGFYEQGKDSMFKKPAGFNLLVASFDSKAKADFARKALAGGAKWEGIMKEQKAENFTKEDKPDFIPAVQFAEAPFSAVKELKAGEISEVIKLPQADKYFIFRMVGSEEERIMKFDEVKKQIVEMIQAQQGRYEVIKLARKLRDRAEIEVLDKSYFEVPKKEEPKTEKPKTEAPAPAK